jgi:hypothetical protein
VVQRIGTRHLIARGVVGECGTVAQSIDSRDGLVVGIENRRCSVAELIDGIV